jgi:hypothetical protein
MAGQDSEPPIPTPCPLDFLQNEPRQVVCMSCGARLEVVVNFKGKIVWPVDPENPDFGTEQPELRGETSNIRVVCSADVMHTCGYVCVDGALIEAKKGR